MNMHPEVATRWIKTVMAVCILLPVGLYFFFGQPTASLTQGMVWIPADQYAMGSDRFHSEESPVHPVKLKGFWVDRTEVTNRQFAEFTKSTGYITEAERPIDARAFPAAKPEDLLPGGMVFQSIEGVDAKMCGVGDLPWWRFTPGANWQHPEGPASSIKERMDHPVVQVSYRDALAYCQWAKKRLPSEAEWECAARGGLNLKAFTWGDEERPNGKIMSNYWQGDFPAKDTAEDGFHGTAPVGSFPPNGYGISDMAGNVWELTADWYDPGYYPKSPTENPLGPAAGVDPQGTGFGQRVMRGGSWLCDSAYCFRYRPSARHGIDELTATNHAGFRCVSDAPAPADTQSRSR